MWLSSMTGTRKGDKSLREGSEKGETFVGGSKLLALFGCLIIRLLGVFCFASLKELPQLLGWCKPFVRPLKTRTLETNCVWQQVKLPICVLKILILFLVRILFMQWQGWKVLPKNWLAAKFLYFRYCSIKELPRKVCWSYQCDETYLCFCLHLNNT